MRVSTDQGRLCRSKIGPCRDLRFSGISGGARIFVDQAAQDGFSEDPSAVEVGNGEVAAVVFTVGDALGDALVRPGRVLVHLVFSKDGAQMGLISVPQVRTRIPPRRPSVPRLKFCELFLLSGIRSWLLACVLSLT
jgi:hypothetical protein